MKERNRNITGGVMCCPWHVAPPANSSWKPKPMVLPTACSHPLWYQLPGKTEDTQVSYTETRRQLGVESLTQRTRTDVALGGSASLAVGSLGRTMEYLQLPMESTRGSCKLMDLLAGQILGLCDLCEPFRSGPNFKMRVVFFLLMCLQARQVRGDVAAVQRVASTVVCI